MDGRTLRILPTITPHNSSIIGGYSSHGTRYDEAHALSSAMRDTSTDMYVPLLSSMQDFLKPEALKVGGVFFDALFNLNKFIGFEQRDPFAERQRRNDPFETDWDR